MLDGAEDNWSTMVNEARETEVHGAVFNEVEDGAVAKVTTLCFGRCGLYEGERIISLFSSSYSLSFSSLVSSPPFHLTTKLGVRKLPVRSLPHWSVPFCGTLPLLA